MDPAREKRLTDLLFAALERPETEQRSFLEAACGEDPELLEEALRCLDGQNQLDSFLETPAGDALLGETAAEHPAGSELEFLEATVVDPESRPVSPEMAMTESIGEHEIDRSPASRLPSAESLWKRIGKRQLGAYPIIGHAGAGGMGQVFIGEDSSLGRRIAVKVLPPEMAERPSWLQRFEREARALATLNHPNIVTIHSIEEDVGVHFLTMELVDGTTLQGKIPGRGIPLEELLRIATDLTDALGAAHQKGVIHRDLKPANIMLTHQGRVKILDFGIAKITGPAESPLSVEGLQIGTVPYMAPEQLLGQPVDERTDLFSLGIVLYQMATGKHPFAGQNMVERISSLLDSAVPVEELRKDLPPELVAPITRCMQTDPADRFQSAEELRAELDQLREALLAEKLLESRAISLPPAPTPWPRPWIAAVAGLGILLLGLWTFTGGPGSAPLVEAGEIEPTATAVLFFQNLTADPESDWLATGITELLVAELSQSPGLAVTSTGAIHRLLADADEQGWAAPTPEMLRKFIDHEQVSAVIRGSYAQLGDVLRIAYTLEEAETGAVLRTESLEERGADALFGLVDRLSASVLESLEASRPVLGPATAQEATTVSLAAWQEFSEAQVLYLERSRPEAAIERLEEALRLDPEFALAHVKLLKIHQSLGQDAEAQAYAQRAIELADQLPLNTRFDVEGAFFGATWTTLGRAIETYDLALKVYHHSRGWRNNLARRYAFFERYEDSIQEFEKLIEMGEEYWGNLYGTANAHGALDDFETGYQLLRNALDERPEHGMLQYSLAWHLTEWGKLDEAARAFDRFAELRPGSVQSHYGLWRLAVLDERWEDAEREAEALLSFDDSFAPWRGRISLARNALYRGRSQEALEHLRQAVEGSAGANRALARCFQAELHLIRGEPRDALDAAEQARAEGVRQWPELRGGFLVARALQELGQPDQADAHLEQLREKWRRQPNAVEERQLQHLSGLLELARGKAEAGITALERAAALLPSRGMEFSWHVFPDHVSLWTDLGEAELAAGRPEAALPWLEKATSSGSEHLEHPVPYLRAHYLLGLAHERAGNPAPARRALQIFLEHWQEADLRADEVQQARSLLLELRGAA